MFIADSVGLDFLNTIGTPVDTVVEWLADGDDLLAWLREAKLVPESTLAKLKSGALPGELDAVAAQARALREWFRGFVKEHAGKPLRSTALAEIEPLNRVLERDSGFSEIVARPRHADATRGAAPSPSSGLELRTQRIWRSPDTLLLPIAKSLAEVICDEDFSYVKACEGSRCTLYFFDRTSRRARRWCAMAICGDRAKQMAHRERTKER